MSKQLSYVDMSKMSKVEWKKIAYKIVIAIICLVSILPCIYIAYYSRPCVDDFNNSIGTHALIESGDWNIISLLGTAWEQNMLDYRTWQGTYISCWIMPLHPGIFGEKYYCIGAWLLMISVFLAIYYLITTIWKIMGLKQYKMTLSLFLFVAIIQWLPCIVQGLYWFNGAWYYMFMLALVLVNIAFILRYLSKNKMKYIFFSAVLSFIISGGNQVSSFLNILLLLVVCGYEWLLKKKVFCGISLFTACVGWFIMFLAPGTAIRKSVYTNQGIVETIIYGGAVGAYRYLDNWMSRRWILFLFLLLPVALYISQKVKCSRKKIFHPLCLLFIALIILCGQFCVPYYAQGGYGPPRLNNIIWIYFMLSSGGLWIYSIVYYLAKFSLNERINNLFSNSKKWMLYSFLGVTLFGLYMYCFHSDTNGSKAYQELRSGLAQEYAREFDTRIELTEQSDSEERIRVKPLPDSEILKPYDITSDYDDWRNKGWLKYYGMPIALYEDESESKLK